MSAPVRLRSPVRASRQRDAWQLALRLLGRDWRSGELTLLFAALVLTVTAVSAVGFFTDRIAAAIERQGGDLLAADLVLSSSAPLPDTEREHAEELGLRAATTLGFRSVVLAGDNTQLVQVKAVSSGYPLRGIPRLRDQPDGPERAVDTTPEPGTTWVDARLLHTLGLAVGEQLQLGQAELTIAAIITYEPDRAGFFNLAPRVMIATADLPATGLITPASRVDYRLLLAGPAASVAQFADWARSRLTPNTELLNARDARPELAAAMDRAARFLHLAALTTVLVAGAALALSSRRFVDQQTDAVAVMRCLGAPRGLLTRVFAWRLLGLGFAASTLGWLLGYVGHLALLMAVRSWFGEELPSPSWHPIGAGYATGLIALAGFVLPALTQLARVPPLRVLRRDIQPRPGSLVFPIGAAAAAMSLLLFWLARDLELAVRVIGGLFAAMVTLGLVGALLVWLARLGAARAHGVWRLGLAGIGRRPGQSILQLGGFGIGLLALLLLSVVRVDLLRDWQQSLPDGAPNRFLINIQPTEVEPLDAALAAADIRAAEIAPMIRGRLRAIGERRIDADTYENHSAQRLANREFNLSVATDLGADNAVIAGRWWSPDSTEPQFSVEEGVAETLGIKLGDRLVFWVSGQELSAPVTSLRKVQWDSFQPNFFVLAPPALLQDQPATWITSFYLPPDREPWIPELLRQFPSLTLIDIDAILHEVRSVIGQGIRAVESVFLFTLAAGLLVMLAGIQASISARRAEHGVLRTLGVGRSRLLAALAVEFATLGLLAGLLASTFATLIGWLLATQVFELAYRPDARLWIIGVPGSAIAIGLAGVLASWRPLIRPPLRALRGE